MNTDITISGSGAVTHYQEDGTQVFPCRCGSTHRGDYAMEDWAHHNCFHGPLLLMSDHGHDELKNQLLCVQCGEVFEMTRESE